MRTRFAGFVGVINPILTNIWAFFMHKMEKKWIPGHENLYAVSRCGKVFSYQSGKEKELKLFIRPNQYVRLVLYGRNGKEWAYAHRLVAKCFVPNPKNLPQVNHDDGDKTNNNDWNLKWSTRLDNVRHAWENGLVKSIGEGHYLAKISKETAIEIYKLINDGELTQTEIAKRYNVSSATITRLKTGVTSWGKDIEGFSPTIYKKRGEGHHSSKLTDNDVIEVKRLLKENVYQKDIAKRFNVSTSHIGSIYRGERWKHISI